MFTQTARTFFGTFFLLSILSAAGHAQSFHPAFHSMQRLNTMLDSLETPHLQVEVAQPDKSNMKFRIDVYNPNSRRSVLTIRKKGEVILYEHISVEKYASLYDLTQLEDGDYQVEVKGGKEKVCTNISIRTETQVNRKAILYQASH